MARPRIYTPEEFTEHRKAYQRERALSVYYARKAEGCCLRCGGPPRRNRRTCLKCGAKVANYHRVGRERRKNKRTGDPPTAVVSPSKIRA